MPDIKQAVASTYVEPRGSMRQVVARAAGGEILGAAGRAVAGAATEPSDRSPIKAGRIGFLAVFDDQVVLFAGKRGAFKPKPTEEVLATVPRSELATASLEKKAVKGVLTLTLNDGADWAFDMPRAHLKSAQAVVASLTAAA
jgi:hypothetical protein